MSLDQTNTLGVVPAARPNWLARPYWHAIGILGAGCVVGAVLFFLVLPTLLIVPMALNNGTYIRFPPGGLTLKWYRAFFSDPAWMASTLFSLKIAAATTITATLVGTMASIAIVRGSLPFKGTLQGLALGPMVIPHIILGVALYLVFAPLRLTGSVLGFLIAHTVLAVPYVVIAVTASLQRFDVTLELAALNCGASRLQAFVHVVLPNISAGVAAAGVFAFVASFDEATVAFFISDTGGTAIGRKMFEDIDFNLTPVIAAASTVIVGTSLLLMGFIHLASMRSRRSS